MERRRFLLTVTSLLAAPSIVRASSLMPISPLDPAWIVAHQNHPIFGSLRVRLTNARNLDSFHGLIQPGQFFWRYGDQLIDIAVFPKTQLDVTAGLISVQNVGLRTDVEALDFIKTPLGEISMGKLHQYRVFGRDE